MDESDGREVARQLGLRTQGVIGILVQAKAEGRLISLRPVLEELVRTDFFLAPSFVAKILEQVGGAL